MSHRFIIPTDSFGSLQSGEKLDKHAFISYETYGALNDERSNCVLWVSCYSQRTQDMIPFIGTGKRFDPVGEGIFLVTVNMPGNGASFSPCTAGVAWPALGVSYHDNARAVHLLLRSLGVSCVALMYGFSMGAMITWEFCVQFPDSVKCAIATCGSAKCNHANQWFLQRLADALRADPAAVVDPETKRIASFGGDRSPAAMETFAGIYADWIRTISFR